MFSTIDWQPNGYLPNGTFQKRYPVGMWVRIHRHEDGTFEVRASQSMAVRHVEGGFPTIEAAMTYSEARFG